MLCPSDDVVLQIFIQQIEFLAEAGNTHCQVVVPLGMLLGIDQRIRINDVKLHIAKTVVAGGDENIGHGVDIPVAEKLGVHFHDCGGGSGSFLGRQLGDGVEQGGQAVEIPALHRRTAVSDGFPLTSAVRRGDAVSAVVQHPNS